MSEELDNKMFRLAEDTVHDIDTHPETHILEHIKKSLIKVHEESSRCPELLIKELIRNVYWGHEVAEDILLMHRVGERLEKNNICTLCEVIENASQMLKEKEGVGGRG